MFVTDKNVNVEEQEVNNKSINALIEDKEASIQSHLKFTIKKLEINQEKFSIGQPLKN